VVIPISRRRNAGRKQLAGDSGKAALDRRLKPVGVKGIRAKGGSFAKTFWSTVGEPLYLDTSIW